jgi:hypothetical protein
MRHHVAANSYLLLGNDAAVSHHVGYVRLCQGQLHENQRVIWLKDKITLRVNIGFAMSMVPRA